MNLAVQHDHLVDYVALGCIDGRCGSPVVGSPGGSLGEFIVVASVLEGFSSPLDEDEVFALMEEMLAEGSTIYHHSDLLHLRLLARKASDGGCELPYLLEDWQDWIESPPAACRNILSRFVGNSDFVGCGHVAAMLDKPAEYGVRRALVESTLRAFYQLLWDGHRKLRFEVLDGSHEEECIAVVPSCSEEEGDWCMAVTPKAEASRFVVHPDAAHFVRSWMARVAYDTRRVSARSIEDFIAGADHLAQQQLEATVRTLAPSLRTMEMTPCSRTTP